MRFTTTLLLAATAHAATITRWHTTVNVITSSYDTTTISTLPPTTVVIDGNGLTIGEQPETAKPESPAAPTPAAPSPEAPSPETQSPETPTVVTPSTSSSSSSSSINWVPTTLSTATASSSSSSSTSSTPSTSSSSSSGPAPTEGLNEFQRDILEQTNKKRALHSAPALEWDWKLTDFAANYAKKFDCNNVKLIHSDGPYGENLAAGFVGGKDPVNAWYDEIKDYDYSNPGYSEATGHFTQLIWKDSSKMGCAKVTCDNVWRQYTICEYSSRGNIVGTSLPVTAKYFSANVLPLLS